MSPTDSGTDELCGDVRVKKRAPGAADAKGQLHAMRQQRASARKHTTVVVLRVTGW